jgi:hypothetical protein
VWDRPNDPSVRVLAPGFRELSPALRHATGRCLRMEHPATAARPRAPGDPRPATRARSNQTFTFQLRDIRLITTPNGFFGKCESCLPGDCSRVRISVFPAGRQLATLVRRPVRPNIGTQQSESSWKVDAVIATPICVNGGCASGLVRYRASIRTAIGGLLWIRRCRQGGLCFRAPAGSSEELSDGAFVVGEKRWSGGHCARRYRRVDRRKNKSSRPVTSPGFGGPSAGIAPFARSFGNPV